MKKVVMLGCENGHVNSFLNFIKEGGYPDIEVIGAYSEDKEAMQKLEDTYGVPQMSSYDEAVGKVDGIIVTARHGGLHYKFAKPYIESGIPMFIDKPITVSEDDAINFMKELKENNIKISGGSCLKHIDFIKELKKDNEDGETIGGLVRAPIWFDNPWGGMFFYAGHLVEALLEIYGRYPNSVKAYRKNKGVLIVVNYDNYNITGLFSEDSAHYYAARYTKDSTKASELEVNDPWFKAEFNEFYDILVNDGDVKISYKDFVAPVFVMNAIYRSLESGKEEKVERYEI